ncbi:MAG: endonuclease domain-containing protein [Deltaproteobacteria bacterium]|nr:endonuclease domain-containing protein [Deltaproteobacteria bacterium]
MPYSQNQKLRARKLRSATTDAEKKLWACLRANQLFGAKFRRQHPIGPFIADFCCVERALVVELDGGQHAGRLAEDRDRTQFLERQGFRVLRFWNDEVLTNTTGVLERISDALKRPHPTLSQRARVRIAASSVDSRGHAREQR